MSLTRRAEKVGGAIGNAISTGVNKITGLIWTQFFIYIFPYIATFALIILLLEIVAMNSTTTIQHLLYGILAALSIITNVFIHLPITVFTDSPDVALKQTTVLAAAAGKAFIGHALALAANIILLPFLVFSKVLIVVLANITDNATEPNWVFTVPDILALQVNNCSGAYPQFEIKDYYLLSTIKDVIDKIGGYKIPGGGVSVTVDVVPGDFWPGDWDEGTTYSIPKTVGAVPGLSTIFGALDTLFSTTFPPTIAFSFVTDLVNWAFGWAFGDYSGLEILNETLFIKRIKYDNNNNLAPRPGGSFFENLFDNLVGKFLGCG